MARYLPRMLGYKTGKTPRPRSRSASGALVCVRTALIASHTAGRSQEASENFQYTRDMPLKLRPQERMGCCPLSDPSQSFTDRQVLGQCSCNYCHLLEGKAENAEFTVGDDFNFNLENKEDRERHGGSDRPNEVLI
ncbi:hypothetical protein NDU88_002211 [Pleurodeles waltl]|uniref:Uncharacterized protein n=1 Tax=Pleurodeles waltl TaxID=8319 RepID=A0AAV7U917_PLEWA|nr:hypothetical protein NDU88_002211 [Pleurodeles waltl]